jgi:hypothetical protein
MTSSGRAEFVRRCQAAEELSTLGYPEESSALWRNAFAQLTELEPALAESVRRLLADESFRKNAWRDRARALSLHCASALPPFTPRLHWSVIAAVTLFALAMIMFGLRLNRPAVTATSDYAPEFAVATLDDGDVATEWLLPDRALGHADFALPRRRSVRAVVLTNGHNRHYLDRGTRRARIVLYDDDAEVDSAEVSFEKVEAEPTQRTAKLAGKQGTRVRVYILEHFGLGSALAEVEID